MRSHLGPVFGLAAMSIAWTWPLIMHFRDYIPGLAGDNYSFLWNLWWMRKALAAPELQFFHTNYLLNPFGVDLVNYPHTALQGYVAATALRGFTIVEAQNLYIVGSVFLNAVCAYALAFDITRQRRVSVLAGIAFAGSPYVAAHLMGQFDLITAWVMPLFALYLRRALQSGRIGAAIACGLCAAVSAYSAYDHTVYLAVFAVAYTLAASDTARVSRVEAFWRGMQAVTIAAAVAAVLCLPLIMQAFRVTLSDRYVGDAGGLRSAPRGVDLIAPFMGNPFHPLYGEVVSRWYDSLGLDRIEAVGWIGIVPVIVLLTARGRWLDDNEARRWKIVLGVFAVWALGPFLTVAGFDTGVPLPQALAHFVPLVNDTGPPGRATVGVYLALAVLMALRLAGLKASTTTTTYVAPTFRSAVSALTNPAALIILLALDYLHAPVPLTALDRPSVYVQLASIEDNGAVMEVPLGIHEPRVLYHATIHGHPVVAASIARMPAIVAQAYDAMPVVGNLIRLSHGEQPFKEQAAGALPFRYLVLDTRAASPEVVDYLRATLDMDLIASGDGRELYAVQGAKGTSVTARRDVHSGGVSRWGR